MCSQLVPLLAHRATGCGGLLVQLRGPVLGDAALGSRRRLLLGVVMRRRQGRTFQEAVGPVVPVPVLARLEALDDRVAGRLGVGRAVLGRRVVTAADVPAGRTAPEMEPPSDGLLTLDTSRPA